MRSFHKMSKNGPLHGLKNTEKAAVETLHERQKKRCVPGSRRHDKKTKRKKNRKVNFKYELGAFHDPGIQESDSETKLYIINSINMLESRE